MASATGSSSVLRMVLRSSRAPKRVDVSFTMAASACGVYSSFRPRASRPGLYSSSIRAAIFSRSACSSGRKVITSSTRPRNSGRRNSCSAFMLFSRLTCSSVRPKPVRAVRSEEPALEVMQITVLEKSTVRPCASLILPSSRICSRMFITSGWAFSISSNRTTL